MKVLVTGGAVYIGSHMVRTLGEKGHDVVVYDNLSTGYRESVLHGRLRVADLADAATLDTLFAKEKFDAVTHFAAHIVVDESVREPIKYYRNNFVNALTLIETCLRHKVDRFSFSSTAAVVGMMVDNAVVVLESIQRHRERGAGSLRAALRGSREVLPAVVSSTATSIIVFLPLVLGGRTEITTWIGEVGRTIIFTLVCSLFLSLTAIPLAMGRLLHARVGPQSRLLAAIAAFYQRVLHWTLSHRRATAGIAFGVFAISLVAFMPVDKSAFTASKVEGVGIEYEFTDNLNHREVEKYVTRIEAWLQARKDSLHIKST